MSPTIFCWTRFTVYSMDLLKGFLKCKEMERRSTGFFIWGISCPLGNGIEELLRRSEGPPMALFSPVGSRALKTELTKKLFTWKSYVDHDGSVKPLPGGVCVVARAHTLGMLERTVNFALFCQTRGPIRYGRYGELDLKSLRNLNNTPVTENQTSAVVTVTLQSGGLRYPVGLVTELVPPYYVRLTDAIEVQAEDVARMQRVAEAGDLDRWGLTITGLLDSQPAPAPVKS